MSKKEIEKKFIRYGDDKNYQLFDDCYKKYWYNNLYLQNATVEELLNNDSISIGYEDIQNLYMTIEEAKEESEITQEDTLEDYIYDNPKEFYQWFLILDTWLFDWLKENNEVVLDTDFGSYWGRCTFGQSIEMDYIFAVFYNYINKK